MYDPVRHQELLTSHSAIDELKYRLDGPHTILLWKAPNNDPADWLERKRAYLGSVEQSVRAAGLDWDIWKPVVSRNATEIKNEFGGILDVPKNTGMDSRRPSANKQKLATMYANEWHKVDAALRDLPPSVEKARGAVMFALEQLDPTTSDASFPEWITLSTTTPPLNLGAHKRRLREDHIAGRAPIAPPYWEQEWSIAQIRYAERNLLRDAKNSIDVEVDALEQELRRALDEAFPPPNYQGATCDLISLLHRSWLALSSFRVRARTEMLVRDALRIALTWQLPDGSWPSARTAGSSCTATTAFATACLSTCNDHIQWRENNRRALDWLFLHRNERGAWGPAPWFGATAETNIITTVAILDACRMEGIPLDHPVLVEAESALLSAQTSAGYWADHRGYGEEYLTALVIEYFEKREQRQVDMSEATILGRGLILRGHALSMDNSASDQVLALASMYHGLEYTIYGFLLKNDVEIRTQRGETLGFREALNAFETLAKLRNWIAPTSSLPFRPQLSEMAAKRDEVIHRMGRVEAGPLANYVENVFGFVGKFDVNALGYSLLI